MEDNKVSVKEALEKLYDLSWMIGSTSVEYLTDKDGEKIRDYIGVIEDRINRVKGVIPMTITEYVEKVAGIELRPYQKKILELMEQHKDDELTWVPSLGRFVFIPKEKKGEDKMINANDLYYDDSEFRYLQSVGIIEEGIDYD